MTIVQIETDRSLARDITSNAVININREAYEQAKISKQKRLALQTRVENLEQKIDLILQILQEKNNK